MPRPMGPQDSLVGIFIFKSDDKNQLAWEDAGEIARIGAENRADREFARVELHTQRVSFLEGLRAWQREVRDPENAHLLIYAHACALAITPTEAVAKLVTWKDLADALPRGGLRQKRAQVHKEQKVERPAEQAGERACVKFRVARHG